MRYFFWLRDVRICVQRRRSYNPILELLEDRTVPACFTVVNTLDSGCGSLRQAIMDANANSGPDTIVFNIPKSDANGGVFVIQPNSALPALTDDGTTIDGRTQTASTGDTNLSGPEIVLDGSAAGSGADGLTIQSSDNQVFGLDVQRFGGSGIVIAGGSHNWIAQNYIGTNSTGTAALGNGAQGIYISGGAQCNIIGTNGDGVGDTAEGNIISGNGLAGVFITGAGTNYNVVAGNLIGTDSAGTAALGNSGLTGVRITGGAQHNLIGTNGDGISDELERNVISGNDSQGVLFANTNGIQIDGFGTNNNIVAGNYIGTDIMGTAALGNSGRGVEIGAGAQQNIIGTNGDGAGDADEGNVISGNVLAGVYITDAGTNYNVVAGNLIGTDKTGLAALGNEGFAGVRITAGAQHNLIGTNGDGTSDELERNVISGNDSNGVQIDGPGTTNNSIRGNSIHDNGGLGIELGTDGVTANDSGDGDTGPNMLQNYPTLEDIVGGSTTRVLGSFNSAAGVTYTIDFYASSQADPSGFGEGQRWLGSATVTTDTQGDASIDVTLTSATQGNEFITATATDPNGNTSEFSEAIVVNHPPTDVEITQIGNGSAVFPIGDVSFAGSFSDVDTGDTHTATWTFTHTVGDLPDTDIVVGTVTESTDTVNDTIDFNSTDLGPGVYTVTLTIDDGHGGVTTSPAEIFVIYDPSEGFVSGGGWINSPEGAYAADPTLTGKANFGFISKYVKGQSKPTGETEFNFKAGDLNFHSSSYYWLVVAGARAQYKGEGTINGTSGYSFMLTAIDGQITGGGGTDKLRIKIWDTSTDTVVYDNQMGADDGASLTTALGGGSIVIHGGNALEAAALPTDSRPAGALTAEQLQPIVQEAIVRWEATGLTAEQLNLLQSLPVHIGNLGGNDLGMQYPEAIWIDDNAAGWGWFVDPTPHDDSEFTTLGNQGEMNRMDLLTVVMHEMGHALGYDHTEQGVMQDTLAAGERHNIDGLPGSTPPVPWQQGTAFLPPGGAHNGPPASQEEVALAFAPASWHDDGLDAFFAALAGEARNLLSKKK